MSGLLAQREYAFAVVATNQYNMSSADGENVIYVTTLGPSVPSPPRDVAATNVSGGSFVVTYSPAADTGGYANDEVTYTVEVSSLAACYDQETECGSCSHRAIHSTTEPEMVIEAMGTGTCNTSVCDGEAPCCRASDTSECGIRIDQFVGCPASMLAAACRVTGLVSSTEYIVAMRDANAMGTSTLSAARVVTTR